MDGNLSYEFNEVKVFQHKFHGGLLIAQDSGCSCPSPFENAVVDEGKFLNSLADFDAFVAEHEQIDTVWNEDYTQSTDRRHPRVVDQVAALRKILERSEEHTSELQSLMRISYAVFCLKKKNNT